MRLTALLAGLIHAMLLKTLSRQWRLLMLGRLSSAVAVSMLILRIASAVTIDTVLVGNAGNAPDSTGLGAVAYEFRIGKTEVTNAQYVEFLNAKAASVSTLTKN